MTSPFDVLGIGTDADQAEVEAAYRRRVKETHPDQGGSAREFQEVRAAYEELRFGLTHEEDPAIPEERSESDPQPRARVEYVNYELLEDHEWDLDDDDLFRKASVGRFDPVDYGEFDVGPDQSLLQAAESCGHSWPYACRGGACANCAVGLVAGELSQPVDHILPAEMVDRGIRLSCLGEPLTDEIRVVYNLKYLPELDELRLPPGPFAGGRIDG